MEDGTKEYIHCCVYIHINKVNGKVYIGYTIHGENPNERWKNGNGYKKNEPYFWKAIEKYGWDNFEHQILFNDLTLEEALEKEKEMILLYDATNKDKGYNLSSGGKSGFAGMHHTEESKEKIGSSMRGEKHPNYNKPLPEWHKEILRKTQTGRTHVVSDETKMNMSKNHSNNRKVIQLTLDGMFIAEYYNLSSAAKQTGAHPTAIKDCCIGRIHTANGFIWVYKEEYDPNKQYRATHRFDVNKIPVVQLNKLGQFIAEYASASDASRDMGCTSSQITACCKQKIYETSGYVWMYKSDYELYGPTIRKQPRLKQIVQLSLDGCCIAIFESTRDAERQTGTNHSAIIRCCKDEQDTANGFKWMYLEDYQKLTEQND
jgi:group I intron endonuclease